MKLHQLSLFLENKPGQLAAPCHALAAAGVDILTLSLADTAEFGILRLIVPDPEQARRVLQGGGFTARATQVVAAEVPARQGGLADVLNAVKRQGINVEYMYAVARGRRDILVFRFDRPQDAVAALRQAGVNVLDAAAVNGS